MLLYFALVGWKSLVYFAIAWQKSLFCDCMTNITVYFAIVWWKLLFNFVTAWWISQFYFAIVMKFTVFDCATKNAFFVIMKRILLYYFAIVWCKSLFYFIVVWGFLSIEKSRNLPFSERVASLYITVYQEKLFIVYFSYFANSNMMKFTYIIEVYYKMFAVEYDMHETYRSFTGTYKKFQLQCCIRSIVY